MSRTIDPPTSKEFERLAQRNQHARLILRRIAATGERGTTYHEVCDPRYCTLITKLKRGGYIEVIGRSKNPLGQIYRITHRGLRALKPR